MLEIWKGGRERKILSIGVRYVLLPTIDRDKNADEIPGTCRQLYDRYLHRYFDALPTVKISNAPRESLTPRNVLVSSFTDSSLSWMHVEEVIEHLLENFEFVLCEVGTGNQLCDAQRGCHTCSKWAASYALSGIPLPFP